MPDKFSMDVARHAWRGYVCMGRCGDWVRGRGCEGRSIHEVDGQVCYLAGSSMAMYVCAILKLVVNFDIHPAKNQKALKRGRLACTHPP